MLSNKLIKGAKGVEEKYPGLISARQVYRWVEEGRIPVTRMGRAMYFRERDIEAVFSPPSNNRRIILANVGDRFRVTVDPAPEGASLDGTFDDYREARGHAGGLRMVHSWPILDLSEEGQRA